MARLRKESSANSEACDQAVIYQAAASSKFSLCIPQFTSVSAPQRSMITSSLLVDLPSLSDQRYPSISALTARPLPFAGLYSEVSAITSTSLLGPALDFLRLHQRSAATTARIATPNMTPTAMPAFAPPESVFGCGELVGVELAVGLDVAGGEVGEALEEVVVAHKASSLACQVTTICGA